MAIFTNELARRLCIRNHPHLATTNAIVPCGEHRMAAERFWLLCTPGGTHSFEVIRDARDEFLDNGHRAERPEPEPVPLEPAQ